MNRQNNIFCAIALAKKVRATTATFPYSPTSRSNIQIVEFKTSFATAALES